MRARNDYSYLLRGPGQQPSFIRALIPEDEMLGAIQAAELTIKRHLRDCIPALLKEHLPVGSDAGVPKFMRQGSLPNGLLIDPVRDSRFFNEADADVGMYLPLEYIRQAEEEPRLAAKAVLDITEKCLTSLCRQRGWTLKRKSSCLRIEIRFDAHVDLTVYATPLEQLVTMAEAVAKATNLRLDEQLHRLDTTWEEIPSGKSLLATKNGWRRSNARAINSKIEAAYALHGEEFRDQAKYLKGHRDFRDRALSVPSVGITLIVADEIDIELANAGRQDLQALRLLDRVAGRIQQHLPTPGNEDLDILDSLTTDDRGRLRDIYLGAAQKLRTAIFDDDFDSGLLKLEELFGPRFPGSGTRDQERTPQTPVAVVSADIPRERKVKARGPRGSIGSA